MSDYNKGPVAEVEYHVEGAEIVARHHGNVVTRTPVPEADLGVARSTRPLVHALGKAAKHALCADVPVVVRWAGRTFVVGT